MRTGLYKESISRTYLKERCELSTPSQLPLFLPTLSFALRSCHNLKNKLLFLLLWMFLATFIFRCLVFFLFFFSSWKKMDIRFLCVVTATSIKNVPCFPRDLLALPHTQTGAFRRFDLNATSHSGISPEGPARLHLSPQILLGHIGESSLTARDDFPPVLDISQQISGGRKWFDIMAMTLKA